MTGKQIKIERKLFETYRELTYKKLEKGLEAIRSLTTKVEPQHIHDLFKKCEEWLKGEVAKQDVIYPTDKDCKAACIIEEAANVAVRAFMKNHHIRLEAPKGENAIAAVQNMLKNVQVRQFPPGNRPLHR